MNQGHKNGCVNICVSGSYELSRPTALESSYHLQPLSLKVPSYMVCVMRKIYKPSHPPTFSSSLMLFILILEPFDYMFKFGTCNLDN